jgi:hypothetical protein
MEGVELGLAGTLLAGLPGIGLLTQARLFILVRALHLISLGGYSFRLLNGAAKH